ncbi:hypothetical protein [Streptomyces sp. NPDC086776]|uniref:hypothetical protein n=1 Tax=Streptomyces sp. NPDC086776 TaxID=3365756 RepID=UPI0038041444
MAAECDIKPDRVGTLARGQGRITTFEKIVQIADALRVPGRVLGLAPRPWETDAAPAGTSSTENGPYVRRRTILQAATSTGLAAALPALHRPDPPRRITGAYVDRLRKRTARLRRLDDILGGGDTYPVYLGEVQYTKGLLRRASFTDASPSKPSKQDGPHSTVAAHATPNPSTRRAATSRATHRTPTSTATAWPSSPTTPSRTTGARPLRSLRPPAPRSPSGRRPPSAPSSTSGSPGPAPSTTSPPARKTP